MELLAALGAKKSEFPNQARDISRLMLLDCPSSFSFLAYLAMMRMTFSLSSLTLAPPRRMQDSRCVQTSGVWF